MNQLVSGISGCLFHASVNNERKNRHPYIQPDWSGYYTASKALALTTHLELATLWIHFRPTGLSSNTMVNAINDPTTALFSFWFLEKWSYPHLEIICMTIQQLLVQIIEMTLFPRIGGVKIALFTPWWVRLKKRNVPQCFLFRHIYRYWTHPFHKQPTA